MSSFIICKAVVRKHMTVEYPKAKLVLRITKKQGEEEKEARAPMSP